MKVFGKALANERGQSTVEMVMLLPILLVVAAIAYNTLAFVGDCAVFDRTFRAAVRLYATCPDGGSTGAAEAQIAQAVRAELGEEAEVSVSSGAVALSMRRYTGTVRFVPTLFGRPLRGDMFGVSLAPMRHSSHLTVDVLKTS